MAGVRVRKDKREDGGINRRHVQRQHLMFLAFIVPNFLLLGVFTYWHMIYQSYLSPPSHPSTKVTRKCPRNAKHHLRECDHTQPSISAAPRLLGGRVTQI